MKRIRAGAAGMVLAFGLLMISPMAAVYAQGEQTLSFAADGSKGVTIGAKGYTFTGGTLQEHTGTYRITGSTDFTIGSASPITVNGGADASVLLDGAVLSTNQGRALIRVAGNSTLRLVLRGTNRVTRTAGNGCGIQVDEGSTLIISGESDEASLDVTGGAYSPAIGAQGGASAAAPGVGGKVVIQGGTVTAAGGSNAAAIGGGRFSYADVEISGGTVEATGGDNGPGIGTGREAAGGTILISGGTVVSKGAGNAAGLGGGFKGYAAEIRITNGHVTAQADRGGIGPGLDVSGGRVVITGGTVQATGLKTGAGIGGTNSAPASVVIEGGTVTAQGGSSGADGGAGIGSGRNSAAAVDVRISGGVVFAAGGTNAAGIGNGLNASGTVSVTVTGGVVTASTPHAAADIVGNGASASGSASVTLGWKASVKTVRQDAAEALTSAKNSSGTALLSTAVVLPAGAAEKAFSVDGEPVSFPAYHENDTAFYLYMPAGEAALTCLVDEKLYTASVTAGEAVQASDWREPAAPAYAVTYSGGEGATGTAPEGASLEEGAKLTLPACPFVKEGYRFGGWSSGGQTYAAGAEFTMPGQAVTFTAVWILDPVAYAVTYSGGEGVTGTAPEGASLEEGAKLILPVCPFVKEGYCFGGWSSGGQTYAAGAEFTMPGQAVTFTAVWTKISDAADSSAASPADPPATSPGTGAAVPMAGLFLAFGAAAVLVVNRKRS